MFAQWSTRNERRTPVRGPGRISFPGYFSGKSVFVFFTGMTTGQVKSKGKEGSGEAEIFTRVKCVVNEEKYY